MRGGVNGGAGVGAGAGALARAAAMWGNGSKLVAGATYPREP